MTDEELLKAIDAARAKAHDAPKGDHGSYAWADRSRDFSRLLDEAKRRGLTYVPSR